MKANYLTSVVLILLFSIVFSNCKKDDPFDQYPWLENLKKTITNCTCEQSIFQAIYEKQTVFYVAMTDELCNGIQDFVLLDKEGKVVRTFSNSEINQMNEAVTDRTVIYRCKKEVK